MSTTTVAPAAKIDADLEAPLIQRGELPATEPFSLHQTIRVLGYFPPCRGDFECETGFLAAALALDGREYGLRVTPNDNTPGLKYEIYGHNGLPEDDHTAIRDTIDSWLSLSDDVQAFYKIVKKDIPAFRKLVDDQYGLHHVRYLTLAEAVTWLVLTQGMRRPMAKAMKLRLVEKYGSAITFGGRKYTTFPEMSTLVKLTADEFAEVTLSEKKGRYLESVIGAVNELTPDWLQTAPYSEAERALRKVPGIGPFTADGILMRGLGRMDRLASLEMPQFSDPAGRVYGKSYHPDDIRARYGSSLGYWVYYLRNSGA